MLQQVIIHYLKISLISYDFEIECYVSVCFPMDPEVTTEKDRATPEPISPDDIEITVNYDPDPTDLVLSSVPGGELFDPRKHKFSDEDLKPQPMIKKAKKVFVPEEQKVCKMELMLALLVSIV